MNSNMLNLLKNMNTDNGFIVNNLIKSKVITRLEIVETALESNIPYLIYYVGRYTKGLSNKNINKLVDALIKFESIKYIYDFAKNVKRAPIDKLADITIKIGTAENIYNFTKDIDNSPIDKLVDAIILKGNSEFIYKLINVEKVSLSIIVDALIELKDGWYLSKISNNTNDTNIKNKILNALLYEFKNAKDIYNYARIVDDAPIDKLADSIIDIGNPEYIYKFANNINNAPINKLADAIIRSGNAEYIFLFAKGITTSPIDKLADAIINTKEITYIELFTHIEGAPEEKLKLEKNRIIVEAMTEEERLEYLLTLAKNNDLKTISYSVDIYRSLFAGNRLEKEEESKPKNKILIYRK